MNFSYRFKICGVRHRSLGHHLLVEHKSYDVARQAQHAPHHQGLHEEQARLVQGHAPVFAAQLVAHEVIDATAPGLAQAAGRHRTEQVGVGLGGPGLAATAVGRAVRHGCLKKKMKKMKTSPKTCKCGGAVKFERSGQ